MGVDRAGHSERDLVSLSRRLPLLGNMLRRYGLPNLGAVIVGDMRSHHDVEQRLVLLCGVCLDAIGQTVIGDDGASLTMPRIMIEMARYDEQTRAYLGDVLLNGSRDVSEIALSRSSRSIVFDTCDDRDNDAHGSLAAIERDIAVNVAALQAAERSATMRLARRLDQYVAGTALDKFWAPLVDMRQHWPLFWRALVASDAVDAHGAVTDEVWSLTAHVLRDQWAPFVETDLLAHFRSGADAGLLGRRSMAVRRGPGSRLC